MKPLLDFLRAKVWARRFAAAWLIALALWIALAVNDCSCDGCRGCEPDPRSNGVDASAQLTRIDQRVDAAVQRAAQRLDQIAAEHDAAVAAFTAAEQREYETVRAQGDDAVEAWINAWYARKRQEAP